MSEPTKLISPQEHPTGQAHGAAGSRRSHWAYREVLALLAVGFLSSILSTSLGVMIAEQSGASGVADAERILRSEARLAVFVQLIGWFPVMAYVVLVVRYRYGMPLGPGLAWRKTAAPAWNYVRLGVLMALGSLLAGIAIGEPEVESPMQELFANRDSIWLLAVFGALVAPVIEEIVFRGFLFAAFEHAHGPWTALILTSVIFALLHGAQYSWYWAQLMVLLGVGTVFGLVRIRSGSCRASTIVHATYNGLLFLVVVSVGEQLG